jgi:serine/threonine protein kinase
MHSANVIHRDLKPGLIKILISFFKLKLKY